jgi:hypothetical protein
VCVGVKKEELVPIELTVISIFHRHSVDEKMIVDIIMSVPALDVADAFLEGLHPCYIT